MTEPDAGPPPAAQPYESSPYAALVMNLGRALLHVGSPAHRLEAAMQVMADRLGLKAEFFSTPTALIVSLGDGEQQQTYLARSEPGTVNLGKIAELTEVMERLATGEIDPVEADRKVREIDRAPLAYAGLRLLAAFVLVSGGICALIGGGWREMMLAAALGGVTGLTVLALSRRIEHFRLLTPIAAAGVTFLGTLWCGLDPATALLPAVISGMIALLPGMDLTISARELATGHLVSGSSRLAYTVIIFALLAFGMVLGGTAGQMLVGPVPMREPSVLPLWLLLAGFGTASLGFTILFQAHMRDWIWMVVACAVAWSAALAGNWMEAPILGAFTGGLAVGLAGNLFARVTGRPGSILHMPGLILLVPGSIGLRSLSALLGQEVIPGLETALLAGLIAVALTTGMILASVLIRPRVLL